MGFFIHTSAQCWAHGVHKEKVTPGRLCDLHVCDPSVCTHISVLFLLAQRTGKAANSSMQYSLNVVDGCLQKHLCAHHGVPHRDNFARWELALGKGYYGKGVSEQGTGVHACSKCSKQV
jgi:hypothetical protein